MEAVNPVTKEVVGSYQEDSVEDVNHALERALTTFKNWREVPLRERERLIDAAGDVLRTNEQRYAELMTQEMGKLCRWRLDQ